MSIDGDRFFSETFNNVEIKFFRSFTLSSHTTGLNCGRSRCACQPSRRCTLYQRRIQSQCHEVKIWTPRTGITGRNHAGYLAHRHCCKAADAGDKYGNLIQIEIARLPDNAPPPPTFTLTPTKRVSQRRPPSVAMFSSVYTLFQELSYRKYRINATLPAYEDRGRTDHCTTSVMVQDAD